MTLEFNEFIRKPFVVEAVLITEENIASIANFVGEVQTSADGTSFIRVDPNLVPNVTRVFPGHFMTRMGDHIRCYTPKVFLDQFTEVTPPIREWVEHVNGKK